MESLDYSGWVHSARPVLVRFATLTLNGSADAEDITQAVLARMVDGFGRFATADAALAYARRAVVNAATDLRRRDQRERRAVAQLQAEAHRRQLVEAAPADARAALDALDLLSPRERAALALRYHDDLSHRQVAAALGVSEVSARAIVSRALAHVRRHLEEAEDDR